MAKSKLGLILRGLGMGIAEVIPGVSGGTIAFITGIYEELIDSIKAVDLNLLKDLLRFDFRSVSSRLNLSFLIFLFVGMGLGLLFGIFFISHMLENNPELLWSAFFALILASIPLMVRTIKNFNIRCVLAIIVGTIVAYFITELSPVTASAESYYIFFGGTVAIVALILPGISGSFILLLLGLYTLIIPSLKNFISDPSMDDFKIIVVFALGCITGLLVFSRLISAAFKAYHDMTVALMSGFMLGSLNKIWPWRNPQEILLKDTNTVMEIGSDLPTICWSGP